MRNRKPPPQNSSPVALIYTRVSTMRQATDGIGLEAQETKCRAHAERMGWPIIEVFRDEGVSGRDSLENRPALRRLVREARSIPNAVVVVYSVSRLARRQKLLIQLLDEQEEGLRLSSATESFDTTTPTGRAMLSMISVFAQLEADMISERTKDALAEVKVRGVKLGRRPVETLAPETVALVKELYATGQFSYRALAEHLTQKGIPTPFGSPVWDRSSIQRAIHARLPSETP